MIEEFWDDTEGGFFYTGKSGEQLIVRNKDFFDNATPSGNSVAAEILLRLSVLTDNDVYRRKAVTIFRLVQDALARYPSGFGLTLGALDFHLSTPLEIAVVGVSGSHDSSALSREIWRRYLPNKVVAQVIEDDERARQLVPLLRDRPAQNGKATIYLCENFTCRQPVTTLEELASQLDSHASDVDGLSAAGTT
ncbi:MAG: hypothetical protein LC754_04815 [Acidobacteria bacterium]|nr:hypothetical protein [Acidobacteriota bacterium]